MQKQIPVSVALYHVLRKRYHTRHAPESQNLIMRIDVLPMASDVLS